MIGSRGVVAGAFAAPRPFKHASGAMATEQVSVVWSFVADIDEGTRAMLEAKASELKATLAQESVMFTIDGEAFFV